MPREVSRRTSKPPETKGKVVYPDQVKTPPVDVEADAIQRGKDMDHYVGSINPTDGKSKGATRYVDNND